MHAFLIGRKKILTSSNLQLWWNGDELKKDAETYFFNKEEKDALGFKISEDRFTLSLSANASGPFKCKPGNAGL